MYIYIYIYVLHSLTAPIGHTVSSSKAVVCRQAGLQYKVPPTPMYHRVYIYMYMYIYIYIFIYIRYIYIYMYIYTYMHAYMYMPEHG